MSTQSWTLMQLLIASRTKDLRVPYCSLPDSKLFPKTFLIFRKSQCSSSIPSNHLISYYSSFFFYPQLQIALPTPLSLNYSPPPFLWSVPIILFFQFPHTFLYYIFPCSVSYYPILTFLLLPTSWPYYPHSLSYFYLLTIYSRSYLTSIFSCVSLITSPLPPFPLYFKTLFSNSPLFPHIF